MTVTRNTVNDSFDIVDISREEVVELMDAFDDCPLPLKRKLYSLKRAINELLIK